MVMCQCIGNGCHLCTDMGQLLAGTRYRDFEERLKAVMKAVADDENAYYLLMRSIL